MKLRVYEAFAGYGSQRLALERLKRQYPDFDYEVVMISEIDRYAISAYQSVHGDCPNYGDVSKIDYSKTPSFDLMTYSYPCTDISAAGQQKGLSEGSGTRSSLLWECRRAIEAKHPRFILMENVRALTQKKFMPEFKKWQEFLVSQGYVNYWQILNAKDYGIPQSRDRVFMVSICGGGSYVFPQSFTLRKRLRDILERKVSEEYYLKPHQVERIIAHCERKVSEGCGFKTNFRTADGISGAIKTKEGSREYDTYIVEPIVWIDGFNVMEDGSSRTIKANYGKTGCVNLMRQGTFGSSEVIEIKASGVDVNYRIRKLTPTECFRLMDVDDISIQRMLNSKYPQITKSGLVLLKPIPKTQLYKLAGNSIVVSCLYHIFEQLFIPYLTDGNEEPKTNEQ